MLLSNILYYKCTAPVLLSYILYYNYTAPVLLSYNYSVL